MGRESYERIVIMFDMSISSNDLKNTFGKGCSSINLVMSDCCLQAKIL